MRALLIPRARPQRPAAAGALLHAALSLSLYFATQAAAQSIEARSGSGLAPQGPGPAGVDASVDALTAQLGKQLFEDTTLSMPAGQGCVSCHDPRTGFRYPDSKVNEQFGVAEGAVEGRFTSRSPPTVSYAQFVPKGPPFASFQAAPGAASGVELIFVGGLFYDGRADDLEDQAQFPFGNPNEMNDLQHGLPSPELVATKLAASPSAPLFRRVFGQDVFSQPADVVFDHLRDAITAYERSPEVSPFSSKFDAWKHGLATLSPEELDGLRLFTGTMEGTTVGTPWVKNARCTECHAVEDDPDAAPSKFTFFFFANIGVPRNEGNPFYLQTDPTSNPLGHNPLGRDFVDYGLGDYIYPLNGLPSGNVGPGSNGLGDFLAANGSIKIPTLRNVDKRPRPGFVKAYMHNGVFKSLKEVVHFYNTRNLTTLPGEVIDFTGTDPYARLVGTPLWAPPEVASPQSLVNPQGLLAEEGGEVGNLGLTDAEEDHVVAFLRALSDGFYDPGP